MIVVIYLISAATDGQASMHAGLIMLRSLLGCRLKVSSKQLARFAYALQVIPHGRNKRLVHYPVIGAWTAYASQPCMRLVANVWLCHQLRRLAVTCSHWTDEAHVRYMYIQESSVAGQSLWGDQSQDNENRKCSYIRNCPVTMWWSHIQMRIVCSWLMCLPYQRAKWQWLTLGIGGPPCGLNDGAYVMSSVPDSITSLKDSESISSATAQHWQSVSIPSWPMGGRSLRTLCRHRCSVRKWYNLGRLRGAPTMRPGRMLEWLLYHNLWFTSQQVLVGSQRFSPKQRQSDSAIRAVYHWKHGDNRQRCTSCAALGAGAWKVNWCSLSAEAKKYLMCTLWH